MTTSDERRPPRGLGRAPLEPPGAGERGLGFAEYALIMLLIVMVALVAIGTFGTSVSSLFTDVQTSIDAISN